MNKQKFIIGGVLVAIILATFALLSKPTNVIEKHIIEKENGDKLGGVSNLDILNVGGTALTQASTTLITSGLDNNGLFEYATTGTCNDASTTLFAIQNPFRATSTVVKADVHITEFSTTTVLTTVGTSSVAAPNDPPIGPHLISFWPTLFGKKNDMYSGAASSTSILTSGIATNTPVTAVILGPWDYLVGFANGTTTGSTNFNYNGGVIGGNNNFACTYSVKFSR